MRFSAYTLHDGWVDTSVAGWLSGWVGVRVGEFVGGGDS